MASFNNQLDRLQRDLQAWVDRPPSPTQRAALLRRAADLVVKALRNDDHPLVACVKDLIALRRVKKLPATVFFMPKRGSSNPQWRRLWPVQFLLCVVAVQPDLRAGLGNDLKVSASMIAEAMKAISQRFNDQFGPSALHWLSEALPILREPEEPQSGPLEFRLEGRSVVPLKGPQFRLSIQVAILLKRLIEAKPKPVMADALIRAGVTDPTETLRDLRCKFATYDCALPPIINRKGQLRLIVD